MKEYRSIKDKNITRYENKNSVGWPTRRSEEWNKNVGRKRGIDGEKK